MIPLAKPHIDNNDIQQVVDVMKTGMLSLGPKIPEFEEKFAKLIETKYAIAVNSGTSGLHLCLRALDIKKGSEVITSPFSFIASANCALFEDAKPVFVDVEEDTFNMNADLIEEKITKNTSAIIPVHIFGQACDIEKVMNLAKKNDLKVIEDACESINATFKDKKVGTFGDAAVFAFYPNKQMTTGEGGMIVTNNEEVDKLCRSMRNQGRGESMQWLTHNRLGYNYRLTDMQAALGISQLDKIDFLLSERKRVAEIYASELSNIPEVIIPQIAKNNNHTWFVFPIRVPEDKRDTLIDYLNKNKIQSKAYFDPCIHLQPFYTKLGFKEGDFPVAEKLSKTTLILPLFVGLKSDDIFFICKVIKTFFSS